MALAGGPPPPPKPTMERKTAYGMLFGGGAALLGLVWAGGMIGAAYRDGDRHVDRDLGRVMPYPLVGPFMAARRRGIPGRDKFVFGLLGVEQWAAYGITLAGALGVSAHRKYDRYHRIERHASKSTIVALTAGGLAGLVLTYGMSVGFSEGHRRAGGPYGRQFYVPLVGGIMAAPHAPNNRVAVGALTSSALQIASAGALATGIALSVRRNRRKRHLTVMPSAGRGHAFVTATLRF